MHPAVLMQVSLLTYGMLAETGPDHIPQQVGIDEQPGSIVSGP